MQETPQQYVVRILGYIEGQEPLRVQRSTPAKLAGLVKGVNKKRMTARPAPEKWSAGEILAHLADVELAVGWRIRSILARNGVSVQAYDQDAWARAFDYRHRDPRTSLATFRVLREANLALLKSAPKESWENYGMHEERGKESITQIVRLLAGHDLNHLAQVENIIRSSKRRKRARK